MGLISLVASAILAWLLPIPSHRPDAIAAEPNPVRPGQAVTLRWYFTGRKVVVSGGRFGKGVVVTGKTAVVDHPRANTRYVFDVDYTTPATAQVPGKPVHARYTVAVAVGQPVPLKLYQDTRGWQVSYVRGWKCDAVPLADPARNALLYFQQEEDSVERLAVSILPAEGLTAEDVMKRVDVSLPSHYEEIKEVSREQTQHAGAPAILTTFTANDLSHPGTRTESVVLAFVRGDLAYVVSARCAASEYPSRKAVLERMLRSFSPASASATRTTP